jgi:dipeptidase E
MELHLFSTPGQNDIRHIIDACRPYLIGRDDATVAFLPQAWLNVTHWLDYTIKSFKGLAKVELIDTEQMELPEMEAIIRRAQVIYISGGNTFLLNHRLHVSRLMPYLRKKVQAGLPVVGFSAGANVCGANILTSNDMNIVPTTYFDGIGAIPFSINVHYPQDESARAERDEWLGEYHVFQDAPVILLEDNAYIKVEGRKTSLVRGDAWILRKGVEKEKLEKGKLLPLERSNQ